jgi:prolipoprotein diacylglyceryltransferase
LIDPVIFSFKLFGITFALRWYGVLVMLGVMVAAWIAEREYSRRGENGEHIWNALIWALPVGVVITPAKSLTFPRAGYTFLVDCFSVGLQWSFTSAATTWTPGCS